VLFDGGIDLVQCHPGYSQGKVIDIFQGHANLFVFGQFFADRLEIAQAYCEGARKMRFFVV